MNQPSASQRFVLTARNREKGSLRKINLHHTKCLLTQVVLMFQGAFLRHLPRGAATTGKRGIRTPLDLMRYITHQYIIRSLSDFYMNDRPMAFKLLAILQP